MPKDKRIIGAIVVVVLVIIVGIFYLTSKKSAQQSQQATQSADQSIKTISPDSIGLKLVESSDQKYINFVADKLKNTKHLAWVISYDADVPPADRVEGADPNQKVTQSFEGQADINPSDSHYSSKPQELGTCSRNVCRFD